MLHYSLYPRISHYLQQQFFITRKIYQNQLIDFQDQFFILFQILLMINLGTFFSDYQSHYFQFCIKWSENIFIRMKNILMNRLTDPSANKQTNRLYQPLREALSKSISRGKKSPRTPSKHLDIKQVKWSKLSKNIHDLTPRQAEKIQKNTYIPRIAPLTPTSNLDKVKGKSFRVVDVNIWEGKPLSEKQFQQCQSSRASECQQIVYQVSQVEKNPSSLKSSSNQPGYLRSSGRSDTRGRMKIESSMKGTPLKLKNNSIFDSGTKVKTQTLYEANLKSSDTKSKKEGRGGWKKSQDTTTEYIKPKREYKYNIFSSLDEATNTKCQKCGSNEIIARRPKNQPWS